MRTLLSIFLLLTVVGAWLFSTTLYVQGSLFAAYFLFISSIAGITGWIHQHGLYRVH